MRQFERRQATSDLHRFLLLRSLFPIFFLLLPLHLHLRFTELWTEEKGSPLHHYIHPPSVPSAHSLLSSSSCLRRCSSASLLFLSFSISPSIFFSLSRSSSSCFFFCMEVRSCSERFTSPWYSVSISFQAMVSVAWRESRAGRHDLRKSGNTLNL